MARDIVAENTKNKICSEYMTADTKNILKWINGWQYREYFAAGEYTCIAENTGNTCLLNRWLTKISCSEYMAEYIIFIFCSEYIADNTPRTFFVNV